MKHRSTPRTSPRLALWAGLSTAMAGVSTALAAPAEEGPSNGLIMALIIGFVFFLVIVAWIAAKAGATKKSPDEDDDRSVMPIVIDDE